MEVEENQGKIVKWEMAERRFTIQHIMDDCFIPKKKTWN